MEFDPSQFRNLFDLYDLVIVFDLETSGLEPKKDEIIDFGLVALTRRGLKDYSYLVKPSKRITSDISDLTHITNRMLEQNGISPMTLASKLYEILSSKSVLISGYNVNFDLGFLFELAKKYDFKKKISNCDFLDIMTVFKDDKIQYPHKLNDALNYYKITDEANSHRAIDDTKATVAVLQEMLKKNL